jgi:hypothetical protein
MAGGQEVGEAQHCCCQVKTRVRQRQKHLQHCPYTAIRQRPSLPAALLPQSATRIYKLTVCPPSHHRPLPPSLPPPRTHPRPVILVAIPDRGAEAAGALLARLQGQHAVAAR